MPEICICYMCGAKGIQENFTSVCHITDGPVWICDDCINKILDEGEELTLPDKE